MARTNTRRDHQLRDEFFAAGKAFAAANDPEANCWLCKEPIDYTVGAGTTPDSHELDHYFSVADYPELQQDPTNFRHSHKLCNGTRGKDAPSLGLGEAVPDWWD